MTYRSPTPPAPLLLNPLLDAWLLEDIGRGDRTTQGLFEGISPEGRAQWVVKEAGVIAGLPIAAQVFSRLSPQARVELPVPDGQWCDRGTVIAHIEGPLDALLTGERVALNLAMRLSGIATATRTFVEAIADLPTQFVDTRKTTPGLRILEKYASQVGGATNHRMGLDDGVMIKDNHIAAAGGIGPAIERVRDRIPYPLTIEVETETVDQVKEALEHGADIIMLDNMPLEIMTAAVGLVRTINPQVKLEASGNITQATLRSVAETGVDYISSSAPITRSTWLDLSMRMR